MKLLMIDNYDSFTYNLVQYFNMLGQEVKVVKNDEISPNDIDDMDIDAIVISPGPCSPKEAGISVM
jgi:anthranilate synthase component 2